MASRKPAPLLRARRAAWRGAARSFPVVALGASAGGFGAVSTLLKHLPDNSGLAFVLVQHLDPTHESQLVELLGKITPMKVVQIVEGQRLQPDHLHVIPPDADVTIRRGIFKLTTRLGAKGLHLPINTFFRSLARDAGSRTIGVILSGTGSDGTLGLGAIKAAGGLTFAEAQASAQFFQMPQSAAVAGCVDALLPVAQIAREILRITRHAPVAGRKRPAAPAPEHEAALEAVEDYHKIFFVLRQYSGVDFAQYKPNTLQRRLARRMMLQKIATLPDYLAHLRKNAVEVEAVAALFFQSRARLPHPADDPGDVHLCAAGSGAGSAFLADRSGELPEFADLFRLRIAAPLSADFSLRAEPRRPSDPGSGGNRGLDDESFCTGGS